LLRKTANGAMDLVANEIRSSDHFPTVGREMA
jgi:hypothetical protein